jgi:hypothetical protein
MKDWRLALLAGGFAALALGLTLHNAEAAERPARAAGHPALQRVLRLHDLPPGYAFLFPSREAPMA